MKVHYTAALLVLFGLHSLGVTDALAGKRKRPTKNTPTEQTAIVTKTAGVVTPSTSAEMYAFISSILSCNLKEVREFIKNSPELLDQYDEVGWSPVHYAAFSGRPLILEKFREQFKDRYTEKFTEKTSNGETPFTLSLLSTKTAIYLLSVLPEETPFLTDANGSTPLHIAAEYLNWEMIGKLLDLYSVDQILQKNNLGQNFLHVFANAGGFKSGGIRVVEDRDYTIPLNSGEALESDIPVDSQFSYLGRQSAPKIPKKIFLSLFYKKDINGKTPEDLSEEYTPEYDTDED